MDRSRDGKFLIERISKGDKEAFEQFFDQYFQTLHNIAYNRLGSAEAADDVVQDVFTDIWRNRNSLSIHSSPEAYFYQAVKNKVFQFIRYQSVREKEEYIRRIRDEYYASNSFAAEEQRIELDELKEKITKDLDQFSEKTRAIFYLSRDKHFSYSEIAEQLNCSQKTVEYHISKVLKHLRVSLKDYMTILFFFWLS